MYILGAYKKLSYDVSPDNPFKNSPNFTTDKTQFSILNEQDPTHQHRRPELNSKQDSKITSKVLQNAFKRYQGRVFSDNVCKFVVRLLNLDRNGGIDVDEFEQLYFNMKVWVTSFNAYDRSRSGYLDEYGLSAALRHMEVNFSPDFIAYVISQYDEANKRITLDQFIMTCIQMQKFSDEFKARDEKANGVIELRHEDFLEMLMKSM